ncbi:MAG: hypothetical protein AAGF71_04635 [Pseudomonadota bacterium]
MLSTSTRKFAAYQWILQLFFILLQVGNLIDTGVLNFARERLEKRLAALNDASFEDVFRRSFTFHQIREGISREEIRSWLKTLFDPSVYNATIYRITVNNQTGARLLKSSFEAFERPKGLVLTRNNNVDDSQTVYVGSSRKISSRLYQHLNNTAKGTYALKLNLWCPDVENSLAVEVTPIRAGNGISLLQDLEDALWERSRPMFGKLGGK